MFGYEWIMFLSGVPIFGSIYLQCASFQAGVVSLTCQALLLSLAVMLYFVGPMEKQLTLFIFLALVVRSSYICIKVADILVIILRKFLKSYPNSQQ